MSEDPAPEPGPNEVPAAFLSLTTLHGGMQLFELGTGRFKVGSEGDCTFQVLDSAVEAVAGAWFRMPDGGVWYRSLPDGDLERCEEGRTEVVGALTMCLTLATGPRLRHLRDGSYVFAEISADASFTAETGSVRSALQTHEEVVAARDILARHVALLSELEAPAPELPVVQPPPPPVQPISPWAFAPLILAAALLAGALLRNVLGQ